MTGKRKTPRLTAQQAREHLWEWLEENYPAIWDDPNSPLLHDENVHAEAVLYLRTVRFNSNPELIHKWLSDTHRFDPFPDPVAIQRAVDLDREVFLSLTDLEKYIAVEQLAAMRSFTGRNPDTLLWDPKRARAWDELPDAFRSNLATIVSKRRQRSTLRSRTSRPRRPLRTPWRTVARRSTPTRGSGSGPA
jgi:hypothetical protein